MLTLLAEELRPFRSIVTFNGRVFDLPLLQTRYIMKGIKADWGWDPHLDLLPVSRRLWRGHFESCRLGCLEEEVLGFFRGEDIPGYAIPPLYVRFLKEQRLSLLEPVLAHNRWDIASLAALAVSVCGIVESGAELSLEEGVDFESAAKVFASADDDDLSLECYREAFTRELPDERRLSTVLPWGGISSPGGSWRKRRRFGKRCGKNILETAPAASSWRNTGSTGRRISPPPWNAPPRR